MIIYFSGTGNSYSVAKKLAAAIGDETVPLIRLTEDPGSYNLEKENCLVQAASSASTEVLILFR